MAPITKYLSALAGLFAVSFAAPTAVPDNALLPRNTANFTIYASSSNPQINDLVFGLYRFAAGYEQGYLYNNSGIPISIANDFNIQINADSGNLVVSTEPSIQVILADQGAITAGSEGTQGFWIEPETMDLAFDFGSQPDQNLFFACPWTGDSGSGILYTVGWMNTGTSTPSGCESLHLHTTL